MSGWCLWACPVSQIFDFADSFLEVESKNILERKEKRKKQH
jgi:hypothetical protein